ASMDMGSAILAAAGLGFIGLGAQPPYPEWGAMISHGRNYLPTWWWYSAFPGFFIYLTVLGFNLLGDGLRDILDPQSRGWGGGSPRGYTPLASATTRATRRLASSTGAPVSRWSSSRVFRLNPMQSSATRPAFAARSAAPVRSSSAGLSSS